MIDKITKPITAEQYNPTCLQFQLADTNKQIRITEAKLKVLNKQAELLSAQILLKEEEESK